MSQRRRSTRKIEETIRHLEKNFQCAICLELMKTPVMTKCGHIFCRHCLHMMIGHKQDAPCPLCKVPFTKRSLKTLMQWNLIVQSVGNLIQSFEADSGVLFSPSRLSAAISSPRRIPEPQPQQQPSTEPQPQQQQQPESLPVPSRRSSTKQAKLVQRQGGKRRIELEGMHIAVLDDSEESQPQNTSNQEERLRNKASQKANKKKAQEVPEVPATSLSCGSSIRSTRSKDRVKNAPINNNKQLLQFIAKGSLEVLPTKKQAKRAATKEAPIPSASTDERDVTEVKLSPRAVKTDRRPSQDDTRSRNRRSRRKAIQEEQPLDDDVAIVVDEDCQAQAMPENIQTPEKADPQSECRPHNRVPNGNNLPQERNSNVANGLMTPECQPWKTNMSVVENSSLQSVTKHKIQKWFKEQKTPVSINLSPTQTCSESLHEGVCENAFVEDPLAEMTLTEAANEKPVVVLDSDQESYHTGDKLIGGHEADVIVEEVVREVGGVKLTHRTRRTQPNLPKEEEMPQLSKRTRGRLRTTSNSKLIESINHTKMLEQQDRQAYQVEPVLFDLSQRDPVVTEKFTEPEIQNDNVPSTSKASIRYERSMLKPVTRTYGRSVTPSKLKKSAEDESFANAKTPPPQRAKFFVARGEKTPVRQKIETVEFDAGSPEDPYAFRTSQKSPEKKQLTGKAKAKKKRCPELQIIPVPKSKSRKEKISDEMVKETRSDEKVKDDNLSSSQAEVKSIEEMLSNAEDHELVFSQQVRDMEDEARLEQQKLQQEGSSAATADPLDFGEVNNEVPEHVLENAKYILQTPKNKLGISEEQNENQVQNEKLEDRASEQQNEYVHIEQNGVAKEISELVEQVVLGSEQHHVAEDSHGPADDVLNENVEVSTIPESEEIIELKAVPRKRSRRCLVQEEPPRQRLRSKGQSEPDWLGVQEMARDLVPQTKSLKLKKISPDKKSIRNSRRLRKGQEDKKDVVVDLTQDEPTICDVETTDSRQGDGAKDDGVVEGVQRTSTSSQKGTKAETLLDDRQKDSNLSTNRLEAETSIEGKQKHISSQKETEPDTSVEDEEKPCTSVRKGTEAEILDEGEQKILCNSPQKLAENMSPCTEDSVKMDPAGQVEDEIVLVEDNNWPSPSMDEVRLLEVSPMDTDKDDAKVKPSKGCPEETITTPRDLERKDGYEDVRVQAVPDDMNTDETESQIKAGIKCQDDGGTQPFNFVNSNETTSFDQHRSQNLSGTVRSQRRTFSLGTNSPVDSKKRKIASNSIAEDGEDQILQAVAQALGSDSLKDELVDRDDLENQKETRDNTEHRKVVKDSNEGQMEPMGTCEKADEHEPNPSRSIDVLEEPDVQVVGAISQKAAGIADAADEKKPKDLGSPDQLQENDRAREKRGNSRSKWRRKKKKMIQKDENETQEIQAPSQDKQKSDPEVHLLTCPPDLTILDSAECNDQKPEFLEPSRRPEIKISMQDTEPKSELAAQSLTCPPETNIADSTECKDQKDYLVKPSSPNRVKEPEIEVQEIFDSPDETALPENQETSMVRVEEAIVIKSQNTQSYESSQSESLFKTSTIPKTASQNPDGESNIDADKSQTQDIIPGTLEQEQNIPVRGRSRKMVQRLESVDEDAKSANSEKAKGTSAQNKTSKMFSRGESSFKTSTIPKTASQSPDGEGNRDADNSQTQDIIPGTLEQEQNIPVRRKSQKLHQRASPQNKARKRSLRKTEDVQIINSDASSGEDERVTPKCGRRAVRGLAARSDPKLQLEIAQIFAGRKSSSPQLNKEPKPSSQENVMINSPTIINSNKSKLVIPDTPDETFLQPRLSQRYNQAGEEDVRRSPLFLVADTPAGVKPPRTFSYGIRKSLSPIQPVILSVAETPFISKHQSNRKAELDDTFGESEHINSESFVLSPTPQATRKAISSGASRQKIIGKLKLKEEDQADHSDREEAIKIDNREEHPLLPAELKQEKCPPPMSYVDENGRIIVRALTTSFEYPVEVEDRKLNEKEEMDAVLKNVEEDLQICASTKKEPTAMDHSCLDSDDDLILPSLEPSRQRATYQTYVSNNDGSETEPEEDVIRPRRKSLQNLIEDDMSDDEGDIETDSNKSRNLDLTSSSAFSSQSDTHGTEQKEHLEEDCEKIQEQIAQIEAQLAGPAEAPSAENAAGEDAEVSDEETCEGRNEEDEVVEETCEGRNEDDEVVEETCDGRNENDEVIEETCEGRYEGDEVVEETCEGRNEDDEVIEETCEGRNEGDEVVEETCEGRNEGDEVIEETCEGRNEDEEEEEPHQKQQHFLLEQQTNDVVIEQEVGDEDQKEQKSLSPAQVGRQAKLDEDDLRQEFLQDHSGADGNRQRTSAQPGSGNPGDGVANKELRLSSAWVVDKDRNCDGYQHHLQSPEQGVGDDSCKVDVGHQSLLPRSLDFSGKSMKSLSGKSVKVISDSWQGVSQEELAQQQETLDPCDTLSQKSTISQSQKSTISQSQQSNESHGAQPGTSGSPLPPTPPNKEDLQVFRRQSRVLQKSDGSPTSFLNKYKTSHAKSLDDVSRSGKRKRKLDVHDEEKSGKVAKTVIKVKEEKDENASVSSSGTAKLPLPKQPTPLQPKMSPNVSSDGSFTSNEIELPSRPHWCFVVSGVKKMRIKARIQKFQQLVSARESQRITPSVTHLIVGPADPTKDLLVCQRTLKYFQAIAARKWVVSVQWVVDSIAKGQLLPEDDYEIHGDTSSERPHGGPQRSRLEGGTLFRQYEMHCVGDFSNITRDEMRSLVESCGGSTVQDPLLFSFEPQHRQLIIVEPSSTLDLPVLRRLYQKYGVTILSKDWVLDSIGSYKLQRSTEYAINLNPESQSTY